MAISLGIACADRSFSAARSLGVGSYPNAASAQTIFASDLGASFLSCEIAFLARMSSCFVLMRMFSSDAPHSPSTAAPGWSDPSAASSTSLFASAAACAPGG